MMRHDRSIFYLDFYVIYVKSHYVLCYLRFYVIYVFVIRLNLITVYGIYVFKLFTFNLIMF